ncbi:MAG: metal ABC transporter substrate-binding protein [Propionibacteriaceae bacterium]|nr:metal ABC transporter substrate-binding protein [Propionibacteriaceae bacterium]
MKIKVLGLAAALIIALSGCTTPTQPSGTLSIVVSHYPYAYLAQAIGGDLVTVTNLTQPGAEPHDLELTTRQVAQIATSDLMIYQAGLQPAVEAAVNEVEPSYPLEVTNIVPLRSHTPDGNPDPHIWLDPAQMITIAESITAALIEIDPENEHIYADQLTVLATTLTLLDSSYSTGLAACERQEFLTSHAAFGYLADRYKLTQIAISGLSPDAEPSPERIAEIHQLAQQYGLTTVFFETLSSPDLAEIIASDLGMRTDVLDPIEGITSASRGTNYPQVMESNLDALREANGCL